MSKVYTLEDYIFVSLFLTSFVLLAIFWIAFARISMARIERDIKRDLGTRPAKWDGIGARAVWYSHAIVVPLGKWNLPNDPLFAVELVRKYAKPKDKTLGLLFMISGYSFLIVGLSGFIMGIG
ncbi:hypothetical protein [Halioxenophilus aromaticivorans]|uniref:Uncharacterized protein n=1 Tax=Halioxenophilus aromaticivorans TaxID=1306992 RepID=A0AAV3U2D9_9ALTE